MSLLGLGSKKIEVTKSSLETKCNTVALKGDDDEAKKLAAAALKLARNVDASSALNTSKIEVINNHMPNGTKIFLLIFL